MRGFSAVPGFGRWGSLTQALKESSHQVLPGHALQKISFAAFLNITLGRFGIVAQLRVSVLEL
jgi:hypothetical protein